MRVTRVYLDTSVIVKRYIYEEGSILADEIFDDAHRGIISIGFSMWNIGEVAVVLDKYMRRGMIDNSIEVYKNFLGEIRLLVKLNQAIILPIDYKRLNKAIKYVFKHGIYIADALQLASATEFNRLLTFDRELIGIAKKEGLEVVSPKSE